MPWFKHKTSKSKKMHWVDGGFVPMQPTVNAVCGCCPDIYDWEIVRSEECDAGGFDEARLCKICLAKREKEHIRSIEDSKRAILTFPFALKDRVRNLHDGTQGVIRHFAYDAGVVVVALDNGVIAHTPARQFVQCWEKVQEDQTTKPPAQRPPLGVLHKDVFDRRVCVDRMLDLTRTISQYIEVGRLPSIEWCEELIERQQDLACIMAEEEQEG